MLHYGKIPKPYNHHIMYVKTFPRMPQWQQDGKYIYLNSCTIVFTWYSHVLPRMTILWYKSKTPWYFFELVLVYGSKARWTYNIQHCYAFTVVRVYLILVLNITHLKTQHRKESRSLPANLASLLNLVNKKVQIYGYDFILYLHSKI